MTGERLGLVDQLRERTAAVVAANPHLAARLTGQKPKPGKPAKPIKLRPVASRGRYPQRTLAGLIELVCRQTDLHLAALRGNGRARRLVDARSCVAVLAEQFASRNSARAIDDALLRGSGVTIWHRDRHECRRTLYPEYASLFDRCHAALVEPRT